VGEEQERTKPIKNIYAITQTQDLTEPDQGPAFTGPNKAGPEKRVGKIRLWTTKVCV
jgi:hypothetical protein